MKDGLKTCWDNTARLVWALKRCAEVYVVERIYDLWYIGPHTYVYAHTSIHALSFEYRVRMECSFSNE